MPGFEARIVEFFAWFLNPDLVRIGDEAGDECIVVSGCVWRFSIGVSLFAVL